MTSKPPSTSNNQRIISGPLAGLMACLLLLLAFMAVILAGSFLGQPAAPLFASTVTPTATATHTPRPNSAATDVSRVNYCNWASFVTDVTIPDDTVINRGEKFTKTWRLKNVGTCAWNADYQVVLTGDSELDGPQEQALGVNVAAGEAVDISIELTAPSEPGTYSASYMLRTPDGSHFALGSDQQQPFAVHISVIIQATIALDGTNDPCFIFNWDSASGELECPLYDDENGSIQLVAQPIIEGGGRASDKALVVQPSDGQDGFIRATSESITIQPGDHFKAIIGCMETSHTCDVTFVVSYIITQSGNRNVLGSWPQTYDTTLDRLDIDLSSLAGQTIKLVLAVNSNNATSVGNQAFWLSPRLIRYE